MTEGFISQLYQSFGLPRWYNGKTPACQRRRHKRCSFDPWVRKIPWSRKWQPTPGFLPGKFHGQWNPLRNRAFLFYINCYRKIGKFMLYIEYNLDNSIVYLPRSPTLQVDYLPAKPQGKPKNTGVDSLSLLQQIFPTQESNWGLLHCRQILYQLSYQGRPDNNKSN